MAFGSETPRTAASGLADVGLAGLDRHDVEARRLRQKEEEGGADRHQFSVGRSILSITITSTGRRFTSSFSPACSWSAVKSDGSGESSTFSGAYVRLNLYFPVRP